MQKLVLKNLDRLGGLAGLADRPELDIRPTLLRVLTDLYVQKPVHTPEEERHYVELALRLIDEVDAGTCAAAAASLAGYPAAPQAVIRRLAPIAALGYPKPVASPQVDPKPAAPALPSFTELRDSFFAADPQTRRIILMSLEAVAAPNSPALAAGTNLLRYLEQSALAGRAQEFTTLLQQALGVSRALAQRIVQDATGEPFATAARALAIPTDMFQRILIFLNPQIGQSVERVYDLAELFAALPQDSALHLVAIWREADRADARAGLYRPVYWPQDERQPRAGASAEHKSAADSQSASPATKQQA